LAKDVRERKAQQLFTKKFDELHKQANVQLLIERKPSNDTEPFGYRNDAPPGVSVGRDVAMLTLHTGPVTVTREELGEFLIQRYGAAHLPMLVNRRIIEKAAREQNLVLTDDEVEAEFLVDCAKHEMNRKNIPENSNDKTGLIKPSAPDL